MLTWLHPDDLHVAYLLLGTCILVAVWGLAPVVWWFEHELREGHEE